MEKYLFNESELNAMNLNESEMWNVMFWDANRVSYLFNSHHRGTEWGKFLAWTVKEFMGGRALASLFDYCEYMANTYEVEIGKVMRAIKEEEATNSDFMICDDDWSDEDVIMRTH